MIPEHISVYFLPNKDGHVDKNNPGDFLKTLTLINRFFLKNYMRLFDENVFFQLCSKFIFELWDEKIRTTRDIPGGFLNPEKGWL